MRKVKINHYHRLFIRKLTISVYVIAACPLSNLKLLNYDHFIVNEENICM